MLYGQRYPAGIGQSTVLAGGDFETYSAAGYVFVNNKWKVAKKNARSGLDVVGAWLYSRHPTTEVLCFVYDLKDGFGLRIWRPDMPAPLDLFRHIQAGYLFEAFNSFFEWCIWNNVCVPRYGWPRLNLFQCRDVAAKAASWTIPASLEVVGAALKTSVQKDTSGARVMKKISKPRNPTKGNSRQRFTREEFPADFTKLETYCIDDVRTEDAVSFRCPDLSPHETDVFLLDQVVNARGVYLDREGVADCISIIEQGEARYNAEVRYLTNGFVENSDKLPAMKTWLTAQGLLVDSLDKDAVTAFLDTPHVQGAARRILEIRQILGSKSVQKTYALQHRVDHDGRVRDLFKYCGAGRTWRFAGVGPQPQNLPAEGPDVLRCDSCGAYRGSHLWFCPQCWDCRSSKDDWNSKAAEQCLLTIKSRSLANVELLWGDPLTAVSGCLRSLFCATPGYELIGSDYSAIEAVVLAMVAGEDWRIEIFRTHGKIYEACQARITGTPLEEILAFKERTGNHHPDRKKFGKIPELASGYGGGLRAWLNFGAGQFMTDTEIDKNVKRWRKDNPAIVRFWYGIEDAAICAVENPGKIYSYTSPYATISYQVWGGVLYCFLPSGRAIPYHSPEISYHDGKSLTFYAIKKKQWLQVYAWGGTLCADVCQSTARDVLAACLIRLERVGYSIVLHVHDEAAAEVPIGFGSIEHFESTMMDHDAWCRGWPIFARGGWQGPRYRKD